MSYTYGDVAQTAVLAVKRRSIAMTILQYTALVQKGRLVRLPDNTVVDIVVTRRHNFAPFQRPFVQNIHSISADPDLPLFGFI